MNQRWKLIEVEKSVPEVDLDRSHPLEIIKRTYVMNIPGGCLLRLEVELWEGFTLRDIKETLEYLPKVTYVVSAAYTYEPDADMKGEFVTIK